MVDGSLKRTSNQFFFPFHKQKLGSYEVYAALGIAEAVMDWVAEEGQLMLQPARDFVAAISRVKGESGTPVGANCQDLVLTEIISHCLRNDPQKT